MDLGSWFEHVSREYHDPVVQKATVSLFIKELGSGVRKLRAIGYRFKHHNKFLSKDSLNVFKSNVYGIYSPRQHLFLSERSSAFYESLANSKDLALVDEYLELKKRISESKSRLEQLDSAFYASVEGNEFFEMYQTLSFFLNNFKEWESCFVNFFEDSDSIVDVNLNSESLFKVENYFGGDFNLNSADNFEQGASLFEGELYNLVNYFFGEFNFTSSSEKSNFLLAAAPELMQSNPSREEDWDLFIDCVVDQVFDDLLFSNSGKVLRDWFTDSILMPIVSRGYHQREPVVWGPTPNYYENLIFFREGTFPSGNYD